MKSDSPDFGHEKIKTAKVAHTQINPLAEFAAFAKTVHFQGDNIDRSDFNLVISRKNGNFNGS